MPPDQLRSQAARSAAEAALVRVVDAYGRRPEFVLIGGLVPELLCATSTFGHAGTTAVDVQVDLEIASGAVNAPRLEQALRDAGFAPDNEHVWRWTTDRGAHRAIIKFELLADLPTQPANATLSFNGCDRLGAANLRGTGFAARDIEVQQLTVVTGEEARRVDVNVTGLAGFLLAKTAAAYSRRERRDWYDIAFVLRHNDAGGPTPAADAVLARFAAELGPLQSMFNDLSANFADPAAQGPSAYASQLTLDHPEIPDDQARADAIVAVQTFVNRLLPASHQPT